MKKKWMKGVLFLLVIGLVSQAGYAAFAMVKADKGAVAAATDAGSTADANIVISEEVKQKIRAAEPDAYEKHLSDYQDLLIRLHVHEKMKAEIERLVLDDHPIWNVLIAYEFLFHHFGTLNELEALVNQREAGQTWEAVFQQYRANEAAFVPRAFDPEKLENLMSAEGIGSDDIMIADRVSFESGQPFDAIMHARMEGKSWQEIAAEVNLLYSYDRLPRVQVTSDQLNQYAGAGMTRREVVEAFVLAHKVGSEPKPVIEALRQGQSPEAIFAAHYTQRYR